MNATEELLAREHIRNVIYSYCRAVDSRDWDAVRACFASNATISHGSYSGPVDKFLDFAVGILEKMDETLHSVGGISIEFDGDIAKTHTTYSSFHHIPGKYDKVGPVPTDGVDTDWMVAGRYCDTLERIGGVWKITKRQAYNDWTRREPSSKAK